MSYFLIVKILFLHAFSSLLWIAHFSVTFLQLVFLDVGIWTFQDIVLDHLLPSLQVSWYAHDWYAHLKWWQLHAWTHFLCFSSDSSRLLPDSNSLLNMFKHELYSEAHHKMKGVVSWFNKGRWKRGSHNKMTVCVEELPVLKNKREIFSGLGNKQAFSRHTLKVSSDWPWSFYRMTRKKLWFIRAGEVLLHGRYNLRTCRKGTYF